jgi:hypothetical protein
MDWLSAELALRAHIETGWATGPYAAVPLVWENTLDDPTDMMVAIAIEGIYGEKTIFGGPGKRTSIEAGIVFYHAFVPIGTNSTDCVAMVEVMTALLELRSIAPGLNMDGGNPPTPVEFRMSDRGVPTQQPAGNYYRCSGSVPFIVIDTR